MHHIDWMNVEPIIHREVEDALKLLPMKKSPGPDDITKDILKATGQNGLRELIKFNIT